MDFFKSFNDQLNDLLHRICFKLQLTTTQHEEAKTHYNAVSEWLAKDENLFDGADITIYPQGSLRIGTTVRPKLDQEFDLDLVCEIKKAWNPKINPIETLNLIEKRLKEHGTYAPMVERMNRCIRLNYSTAFHMDILPAYPSMDGFGFLKVPDRELKGWKESNPKGYAKWFDEKCVVLDTYFEKKAIVEPLPYPESVEIKPPLKRAIQLIKRYRDIYFEDSPKLAPISIVLSTLAAEKYNGNDSVTDTLSIVLDRIFNDLKDKEKTRGRIIVLNPANPKEDLSERWDSHPERYREFVNFIEDFRVQWSEVEQSRGVHNLTLVLNQMFGETVTSDALRDQVAFVEKARGMEKLGIVRKTGTLTTLGLATKGTTLVKGNTFFGEE